MHAADMIEMYGDHLGRCHPRQVMSRLDGDMPAIAGEELLAFSLHLDKCAVQQAPPALPHAILPYLSAGAIERRGALLSNHWPGDRTRHALVRYRPSFRNRCR